MPKNLCEWAAFAERAGPRGARRHVTFCNGDLAPTRPRVIIAARGCRRKRPRQWKSMSEADRGFSRQEQHGARTPTIEKRLIRSARRRGGFGGAETRVVEVVHVRRNSSAPREDHCRPAPWSVRAETWPEGFRTKPELPAARQVTPPVATEPAQPTVHVMAMWEPSPPQAGQPTAEPAESPIEASAADRRKSRTAKRAAQKGPARRFADPFADDDSGANCIRCGYLVEPARERRGLVTCSACR
jgi:hypothetical protein